jgi:hypothetical protein
LGKVFPLASKKCGRNVGLRYELFKVAAPTQPPIKNIHRKETGLQKKVRGVFPVKVFTDSVKKIEGVGGV